MVVVVEVVVSFCEASEENWTELFDFYVFFLFHS